MCVEIMEGIVYKGEEIIARKYNTVKDSMQKGDCIFCKPGERYGFCHTCMYTVMSDRDTGNWCMHSKKLTE